MVRNWNAWHHHMALVMLANAYFAVLSEKIQKNVQDFDSWGHMDTEVP